MRSLLVVALLLAGCGQAAPDTPVVADAHARCVAHDGLPDSSCTPGDADPRVTQDNIGSTICRRGYAASVRPPEAVTHEIKVRVTRDYGMPDVPFSQLELDHLIPLSLGGASTVRNLWPEVRRGAVGAARKDEVEQQLQDAVCRGRMTLRQARQEIATDWRSGGR